MILPPPEQFHAIRQFIYELTDTGFAIIFSCAVILTAAEKLKHLTRRWWRN